MNCPYCKEEIKAGAKKCKICGEFLGFSSRLKRFIGLLGGFLSLIITIGSLGLAYLEYQGRIQAEEDKNVAVEEKRMAFEEKAMAEEETRLTLSVLEKVPKHIIEGLARSEFEAADNEVKPVFRMMMNKEFAPAEMRFMELIKRNPDDEKAKRGLIYSRVLKEENR